MKYFLFTILMFSLSCCSQNNRLVLGKKHAQEELNLALSKNTQDNLVNNNTILIKDSTTAIKVAEPILFSIYSKENIIKQRPYETYLIDNYWVISGTLPQEYKGGTFLIIIDARNSQVIKIIHSK